MFTSRAEKSSQNAGKMDVVYSPMLVSKMYKIEPVIIHFIKVAVAVCGVIISGTGIDSVCFLNLVVFSMMDPSPRLVYDSG